MQEKKGFKGVETGFAELDKLTSGLQNGDLIIAKPTNQPDQTARLQIDRTSTGSLPT